MRLHPSALFGVFLTTVAIGPAAGLPAGEPRGWIQEAKLVLDDVMNRDWFGASVSLSGNTALIGAPNKSGATTDSGTASVYIESSGSWALQAEFHPADAGYQDEFGRAVCIDGNRAVVGAPGDDDGGDGSGFAYVFVRSGTAWVQAAKLTASDPTPGKELGSSVFIRGDTAIVGARGDHVGTSKAGSAYVFVRTSSGWTQEAKLTAADPRYYAHFGHSVALDGDTTAIGAHGDSEGGPYSGAAYVFVRSGSNWTQQAKLTRLGAAAHDNVGWSVSLSGDTALIGSLESSNAGAAYAFVRTGAAWHQEAKLMGSDSGSWERFGNSVAVAGDRALVGSYLHDGAGTYAGAAYVFEREGTSWSETVKLLGEDTETEDRFGNSVALAGDTALIGAYFDVPLPPPPPWTGTEQGSAYVFKLLGSPGLGYCFGDPGSGTPCPCSNDNDGSLPGAGCANGVFPSGAKLVGDGVASVTSDTLVLRTAYQEPNNSGLYFQGTTDLSPGMVWGDGLRCTGGAIKRLQVRFADTTGSSNTTIPISVAGAVSAGDTRHYQLWYRTTANPPCGSGVNDFNSSNGYTITWAP